MEQTAAARNRRKTKIGKVVSNNMQNSIMVSVERRIRHRIYGKYYRKSSKFMVHDANNECGVGDTVRIMETRPLSKLKRWRLVEVIEKAK
jgi:small subunit ribosomal protein S17